MLAKIFGARSMEERTAFSLIMFVSAVNLYMSFPIVRTILAEGINYNGFDGWNFLYLLVLLPFNVVFYFLAILLIILAIIKSRIHLKILLLPIYGIFLKCVIFFGGPSLNVINMNVTFLRDYAVECLVFLLALFGMIALIYKTKSSLSASAGFNRAKIG